MAVKKEENILRLMRKECGMSQTQLAAYADIPVGTIRKLESGERDIHKISLEKAFKLAVVLNIPMEYLLDTSRIKINQRFVPYWKDYMEAVQEVFWDKHCEATRYVPYSEVCDPYDVLADRWGATHPEAFE